MDAEHVCDGDGHVALALARDDDGGERVGDGGAGGEHDGAHHDARDVEDAADARGLDAGHLGAGRWGGGWVEGSGEGCGEGVGGEGGAGGGGGGEGGRGARWCVGVCRVGPAVRRQRT